MPVAVDDFINQKPHVEFAEYNLRPDPAPLDWETRDRFGEQQRRVWDALAYLEALSGLRYA